MTSKDLQYPDSGERPAISGQPGGGGGESGLPGRADERTTPEQAEEADSTIEAFDREGAGIAPKE